MVLATLILKVLFVCPLWSKHSVWVIIIIVNTVTIQSLTLLLSTCSYYWVFVTDHYAWQCTYYININFVDDNLIIIIILLSVHTFEIQYHVYKWRNVEFQWISVMTFSHLYAIMKHNRNMINKHIFTITLILHLFRFKPRWKFIFYHISALLLKCLLSTTFTCNWKLKYHVSDLSSVLEICKFVQCWPAGLALRSRSAAYFDKINWY